MNTFLFYYLVFNFAFCVSSKLCPFEGIRVWKILIPGQLLGEYLFGTYYSEGIVIQFLNRKIK